MNLRMTHDLTVFIVDDDPAIRDALSLLLGVNDYRVAVFADGESFLRAFKSAWRGCLLLDIRMPGMDGLALQQHLRQQGNDLPVIIMTGHGDVSSARDAFRAMAIDFLEKPLDQEKLLAALKEAMSRYRSTAVRQIRRDDALQLLETLTPREREVMDRVIAGHHNREIAADLGISPRTVEVHKSRMMDKLRINGVADLVRFSLMTDAPPQA